MSPLLLTLPAASVRTATCCFPPQHWPTFMAVCCGGKPQCLHQSSKTWHVEPQEGSPTICIEKQTWSTCRCIPVFPQDTITKALQTYSRSFSLSFPSFCAPRWCNSSTRHQNCRRHHSLVPPYHNVSRFVSRLGRVRPNGYSDLVMTNPVRQVSRLDCKSRAHAVAPSQWSSTALSTHVA